MANENDPKLPVSDLPLAFELNNDDKLPVTQGTEGHYIARNATASLIGDYIAKDKTFTELTTTNKKIIAAINEAATSGTEILSGTSAPTSSQGENGNLYIQYTVGVGGANDTVDALFSKLDGAWCEISTSDVGTLDDLSDVDITSGSLGTTQVLMFDGGTDKWENTYISISGEGGSGKIHDVNANSPSNNDVLMWDGTYDEWENKGIHLGNLFEDSNISDVSVDNTTLNWSHVLVYDTDDDVWKNRELQLGHTNSTSDFGDVYLSQSISNNEMLLYDYSTNKWKNGTLFKDLYGTLTIGSTSVVITNTDSSITVANASLEVFTDTFGVNPTDITISGNNISLTFEAQSSTVNVKVRLWK